MTFTGWIENQPHGRSVVATAAAVHFWALWYKMNCQRNVLRRNVCCLISLLVSRSFHYVYYIIAFSWHPKIRENRTSAILWHGYRGDQFDQIHWLHGRIKNTIKAWSGLHSASIRPDRIWLFSEPKKGGFQCWYSNQSCPVVILEEHRFPFDFRNGGT